MSSPPLRRLESPQVERPRCSTTPFHFATLITEFRRQGSDMLGLAAKLFKTSLELNVVVSPLGPCFGNAYGDKSSSGFSTITWTFKRLCLLILVFHYIPGLDKFRMGIKSRGMNQFQRLSEPYGRKDKSHMFVEPLFGQQSDRSQFWETHRSSLAPRTS